MNHYFEAKLGIGLGLIGIGRPWPTSEHNVITMAASMELLNSAVEAGVRFFDTAAAYGVSEERLGKFLTSLSTTERDSLFVATKAGEEWPTDQNSPPDHSIDALEKSLDRSLNRLGSLELLQLHKCSVRDMHNDELLNWFAEQKRTKTVGAIGISVSKSDALIAAIRSGVFDTIQFPANIHNTALLDSYLSFSERPLPVINRPLESGKLTSAKPAFAFLRSKLDKGIILTGTTKAAHLWNNISALAAANE